MNKDTKPSLITIDGIKVFTCTCGEIIELYEYQKGDSILCLRCGKTWKAAE